MIRHIAVLLTVLAATLASGCAPKFEPPPGYTGGFLWNSNQSRTVTVGPGDTLYTISRRYDVPAKAIIARNGLTPPYALRVGQELILDPARSHKVVAGDTLSGIARAYGVEMRLIAEANDLAPPYLIKVDQMLWIPDPFSIAAAPVAAPGDMQPVANLGTRPAIAVETLPPPPGSAPVSGEALPPPAPQAYPPSPVGSVPPGSSPAASASLPPPTPLTPPPPRAASRFSWPLPPGSGGQIVAGFGPAGKGLHNDGINIAVAQGTEVRAADNGVVAYAGNELRGFGNLLLIKHADGWTTAYAHNEVLLVQRGDQVRRGQVIARVGKTGNVTTPQLHFEVRTGTQAVDPLLHLERPVAARP